MNIPEWTLYLIGVVIFWIGYATAAMLHMSREEDIRASILGDLGTKTEGKHSSSIIQGTDTQSQKVLVSDILAAPKTSTRKVKAATNGTQKRVVKNV